GVRPSLPLPVRRVLAAEAAVLLELELVRRLLPVLQRRIVPALAFAAGEVDDLSHCRISVQVPAPTVRPPSRMANLRPFSIAIGVISSIARPTLSPGITISTPSGSVATPVTSVVRK